MIPFPYRLVINSKNPFLGKKQYCSFFILITKNSASPQWSVRVSKRIDKRAVVRNCLRRRISQWLYQEKHNLKPQQSLIILTRPPSREDFPLFFGELKQQLFKTS